jgi:Protein of unknown function (DUF4446)
MSTYVAVFALLLGYVALVAAYAGLRTLAKLRRATTLLARGTRGPQGQQSLLELAQQNTEAIAVLNEQLDTLRTYIDTTRTDLTAGIEAAAVAQATGRSAALRNVALVRYDAFADMSGRMSFSLALLDEHGDGVAISAIAGQTDTRVYAKGVHDGKGEHELSPEERQAVESAMHRPRRGLLDRKAG